MKLDLTLSQGQRSVVDSNVENRAFGWVLSKTRNRFGLEGAFGGVLFDLRATLLLCT